MKAVRCARKTSYSAALCIREYFITIMKDHETVKEVVHIPAVAEERGKTNPCDDSKDDGASLRDLVHSATR
jgi:hypothetical protein